MDADRGMVCPGKFSYHIIENLTDNNIIPWTRCLLILRINIYLYLSQGIVAGTYTNFALYMCPIHHGIVNMTGFMENNMDAQSPVINVRETCNLGNKNISDSFGKIEEYLVPQIAKKYIFLKELFCRML